MAPARQCPSKRVAELMPAEQGLYLQNGIGISTCFPVVVRPTQGLTLDLP